MHAECRRGVHARFEYSSVRSTGPTWLALPEGSLPALAKSEDCEKGLVDAPELFGRHVPNEVAQPGGVNSSNLFHQDSRGLTFHVYFGPERRGPGTTRSRGHKDNGS